MKPSVKLKIILASYAFYMLGGVLSAWFVETNNITGSVIAVVLPTCVGLVCVTLLTQQVQPKKRLPVRRASRVVKQNLKVVR
jgi:hypothetical protein